MPAKNLSTLYAQIQDKIIKALEDSRDGSLQDVVKEKIAEHVESDVYDVYEPKKYQRLGKYGGLQDKDNMKAFVNVSESTLEIANLRYDIETNRYVAPIVISGQGYYYNFPYAGISRPFMKETQAELKQTKEHVDALKNGLKRQGLKVQ